MQENTDGQFNELRNKINEQNKYFTKEIETLKNNHIEILEISNELLSKGNRADQREKIINDIEDRNLEMMQSEEERYLSKYK